MLARGFAVHKAECLIEMTHAYFIDIHDVAELLHKGVESVINNDLFHLQTTTATSTLKVASDLKMWMEESNNQAQVEVFAAEVTVSLKRCIPCPQSSNQRLAREKLWTAYHQLRTSEKYTDLWRQFLQ